MHFHKQPSPDCLVPLGCMARWPCEEPGTVLLFGQQSVLVTAREGGVFHLRTVYPPRFARSSVIAPPAVEPPQVSIDAADLPPKI